MTEIHGQNLFHAKTPGSLGVVTNTRYVRCFWPRLDEPVALFARGSTGIEVQGPPTPRNVVFPEGTVFLNTLSSDGRLTDVPTRHDCFFLRTREVQDVPEEVEAAKVVEIEPGLTTEVKYRKTVTVQKEVDVIVELTEAEAKERE